MSWPVQLLRGASSLGSTLEPSCPSHSSRALLRCFGFIGYASYWDSLVPAWTIPVALLLGVGVALTLLQLRLVLRARVCTAAGVAEVTVEPGVETVHSQASNGSCSLASDVPERDNHVHRVRRGRGTLA